MATSVCSSEACSAEEMVTVVGVPVESRSGRLPNTIQRQRVRVSQLVPVSIWRWVKWDRVCHLSGHIVRFLSYSRQSVCSHG
jgi:hypothetical protein